MSCRFRPMPTRTRTAARAAFSSSTRRSSFYALPAWVLLCCNGLYRAVVDQKVIFLCSQSEPNSCPSKQKRRHEHNLPRTEEPEAQKTPREPMRYCCDWCVQVLAAAERWPCASASGHTLVVDTLQDQARPLRRSTMHLRRHATEILAHSAAHALPTSCAVLRGLHARSRGPTLPHLHRDWAPPCHIRTGTGLAPATSAPGPAQDLRRKLRSVELAPSSSTFARSDVGSAAGSTAPSAYADARLRQSELSVPLAADDRRHRCSALQPAAASHRNAESGWHRECGIPCGFVTNPWRACAEQEGNRGAADRGRPIWVPSQYAARREHARRLGRANGPIFAAVRAPPNSRARTLQ